MRVETFHTPAPAELTVRVPSGSVAIEAAEGEETQVELEGLNDAGRDWVEQALVEQSGGEVVVSVGDGRRTFFLLRTPKIRVRIRCPLRTRVSADVVAADLNARGRLGPVVVKSVSADVELDEIDGDLELKTVSGDAVVGRVAGSAKVGTLSGDVRVRAAGGSVEGRTISGDLELDSVAQGTVSVQSTSGDITIGIVPGTAVWMDLKSLSGDTRSELAAAEGPGGDPDSSVEIRAKSISGDIRLVRA